MYTNKTVRLILGKDDIAISFTTVVKKRDSISHVIFLFLVMVFAETLEENGTRQK